MDFERLRQVDKLFYYRWDAFIVASLTEGPMRFTALSYAVSLHARVKVPDSSIVRGIDRLTRADIIDGRDDGEGHQMYALTPKGLITAAVLKAITAALRECQDDMAQKRGL
jgi:DNA-binding PadR family transcriptional regulator